MSPTGTACKRAGSGCACGGPTVPISLTPAEFSGHFKRSGTILLSTRGECLLTHLAHPHSTTYGRLRTIGKLAWGGILCAGCCRHLLKLLGDLVYQLHAALHLLSSRTLTLRHLAQPRDICLLILAQLTADLGNLVETLLNSLNIHY